jgi:hypothetical protein
VSRLQNSAEITPDQLDAHLRTHLMHPDLLRADNFTAFFEHRQSDLLQRIGQAMGKPIERASVSEPEESVPEYESDEDEIFDEDNLEPVPA